MLNFLFKFSNKIVKLCSYLILNYARITIWMMRLEHRYQAISLCILYKYCPVCVKYNLFVNLWQIYNFRFGKLFIHSFQFYT